MPLTVRPSGVHARLDGVPVVVLGPDGDDREHGPVLVRPLASPEARPASVGRRDLELVEHVRTAAFWSRRRSVLLGGYTPSGRAWVFTDVAEVSGADGPEPLEPAGGGWWRGEAEPDDLTHVREVVRPLFGHGDWWADPAGAVPALVPSGTHGSDRISTTAWWRGTRGSIGHALGNGSFVLHLTDEVTARREGVRGDHYDGFATSVFPDEVYDVEVEVTPVPRRGGS